MCIDWSFDYFYVMVGKLIFLVRLEVGVGVLSYF